MGILDAERRQQIVDLVDASNGLTVGELSERFAVSAATIRRDLMLLSKRGLIDRAHGGAARRVRGAAGIPEPPLQKRATLHAEEKHRIGMEAAKLVEDGETVIISGGTTTAQIVPYLADRTGLTVITNSLNIALLLAPFPAITVIMLGGTLRHSELTTLGSLAEDALHNLRADKLLMGSSAIHVGHGISADNLAEARSDQLLMAAARETTVVADHTKFGRIATVRVAPLNQIQRIITSSQIEEAHIQALREQGVDVLIAN